jgi:hypothetical protein
MAREVVLLITAVADQQFIFVVPSTADAAPRVIIASPRRLPPPIRTAVPLVDGQDAPDRITLFQIRYAVI